MPDFPRSRQSVLPLFISSYSRYGIGQTQRGGSSSSGVATTTWVANLAVYIPVAIPFAYPVARVFWVNGATITSTNVDFGIYTAGGSKIYSTGSTAMSAATSVQYVTPSTPFVLPPDYYYFAWTCSNTTNRANSVSVSTAANGRMVGLLQESSALPLPATMTPASWAQTFGAAFCGITRTASGF